MYDNQSQIGKLTAIVCRQPDSRALNRREPRNRPRVNLLGYSPLLVMAILAMANGRGTADPDLWGHIRFGQAVLSAGHVVRHDPYSYSAPGGAWHDHEWLSEVVMALFYQSSGVFGLRMWKLLCSAVTIGCLTFGLAETGASSTLQLGTLGIAAIAIMPQMQFRPQLHTFALFAAMLLLIARDRRLRDSAELWWAVPLMTLWANLHGGFIVGIAALGIYAGTAAAMDVWSKRRLVWNPRLIVVAGAATLATLITPYGLSGWETVAHTVGNTLTYRLIMDWQPLTAMIRDQWHFSHSGTTPYLCALALMAALGVSLIIAPQCNDDLALVIIAAVMCGGAFLAVRNLPLAVIACAAPAARHIETAFARIGLRDRAMPDWSRAVPGRAASQAAICMAVAVLAVSNGLFSSRLSADIRYPAGAVAFMRQHHLSGNVLCEFAWGEYLIWQLYPSSRVFIDSRYDMVYPPRVINDDLTFFFDRPGAAAVLRAYPHGFVMIPPRCRAYGLVRHAADWTLIYQDSDAALFARADSAAARFKGAPAMAAEPATQYFP